MTSVLAPCRTYCFLRFLIVAVSLLCPTPAAAQIVLTSPSQFSGAETVIDFEDQALGTLISTQYASVGASLFKLDGGTGGDKPVVFPNVGFPSGSKALGNFPPGFSTPLPSMSVRFNPPINRVGFLIRTSDLDDLKLDLKCVSNGLIIGTQNFVTGLAASFVGLEAGSLFDEIIVDVSKNVNGAFLLDDLRFESTMGPPIYSTHGDGTRLGLISTTTGAGTDIGPFGRSQTWAAAFDTDGTLYTLTDGFSGNARLATVNPATAAITHIGSGVGTFMICLEFAADGTLYGVGYLDRVLYRIEKTTGTATAIGDTGITFMMDLAFDSSGTLWATVSNNLWTLNTSTGAATLRFSGIGAAGHIMGIMFDASDTMFATTYTPTSLLYRIDTSTGAPTFVGSTGFYFAHGGDIHIPTQGKKWIEVGDAGSLPLTAQEPTGDGPLASICGNMDFTGDVDMYKICLTGGGNFSATVSREDGFDAQLFLFDSSGKGVYSSDDTILGIGPALLPAGHPLTPVNAGVYYLAVSRWNIEPHSAGGNIFPDGVVLNGPTGPGAGSPVSQWLGTDFGGPTDYVIELTGAICCPSEPGTVGVTVPSDITQECDSQAQTATVNFVIGVTGSVPSGSTLRVTDTTNNRVLLNVAATAGNFGVGPNSFPIGVATVVAQVLSSASGVLASESFTVTVADTIKPTLVGCTSKTIECQGPLSQLNQLVLGISATDDCDPDPEITFSPSLLAVGIHSVTVTATDDTGNAATCSITVTVRDTVAPSFTACPGDIRGECTGPTGRNVSFTVAAVDACGGVSIACKDQNGRAVSPGGTTFACGSHTVTCTATDAAGNSSECKFDVTVVDTTKPVITCPDDITVGNDPGKCTAEVTFAVTATDLCDPNVEPVCTAPWGTVQSGDEFPVGTTTVVCTAKDKAGNTASCSFNITVEDREAPAIAVPAGGIATLVTDCKGSPLAFTADHIGTSATDNCDPTVTLSCSPSVLSPGTTRVTCTAVDAAGNRSSSDVDVTLLKGPFDCQFLRPLDRNVDNEIRPGQTVPVKLKVTCENVVQTTVTAKIDQIQLLDSSGGTPIANEVVADSGASNDNGDLMRLADGFYVYNLSTKTLLGMPGRRHKVMVRVSKAGHVDTLCEVILINR